MNSDRCRSRLGIMAIGGALVVLVGCMSEAPSLVVGTPMAEFGAAECGGDSKPVDVHMSNVTHASLSWNASVDGPYALIGPISGTIDGNRAGAIRVVARFPAFVPSRTVIPGTLIITNNDPEHPVVRIPLTATAYGGELHAEATSFGDIPVTASSPAVPVLLKNSGNAPVDVELGMPSLSQFVVVTPGGHREP